MGASDFNPVNARISSSTVEVTGSSGSSSRLALIGGQRLSCVVLPLAPRGVRRPERRLAYLMDARAIMQSILERLLLTRVAK